MLEIINSIPDWLGAAICGALGWFGHVIYTAWINHTKPYEQDQKRFDEIIKAIDPYSMEAFEHVDIGEFSALHCENLMKASGEIDLIDKFEKSCLDKELKAKEQALVTVLNKITQFIAWKSFYKRGGNTSRTFLWDSYDDSDEQQRAEAQKIKAEIEGYGRQLKAAFKVYKSYGDKKFAKKVS